jgi:Uma2 family endonuclease
MPVMILDPMLEQRIRTERQDQEMSQYDEVWEGVLVVAPLPNTEHQRIVQRLSLPFSSLIDWDQGSQVLPGVNVSDRDADWLKNYREPDLVVYLATNPAKDKGTHWIGGPDLAVEIVSPGEDPHHKLAFYAKVNTRELLIIDRDPWQLELYHLNGGKLILQGHADATNGVVLTSEVLPLTFHLKAGTQRPTIVVTHMVTKETWTA